MATHDESTHCLSIWGRYFSIANDHLLGYPLFINHRLIDHRLPLDISVDVIVIHMDFHGVFHVLL